MGTAIIVEFFHPTAGNQLQLPKEFMHQAGIDFDYDKERVLVPSLTNEGLHINPKNLSVRDEKLKSTDTFKELIGQKKDAQLLYDYLDLEVEDFNSEEEFEAAKEAMLQNDNILKLMLDIFGTNKEDTLKNIVDIRREINNYLNVRNQEKAILSNNLLETIKESLQQTLTIFRANIAKY